MNEFEWLFYQDIREKKRAARGMFNMASRGKGFKGAMKTTSDFLTVKQKKELSSKVRVYSVFDEIMSITDFKLMEKTQQALYMEKWLERFTKDDIATKWECTASNVGNWIHRLRAFAMAQGEIAKAEVPKVIHEVKQLTERVNKNLVISVDLEACGSEIRDAIDGILSILKENQTYVLKLEIKN